MSRITIPLLLMSLLAACSPPAGSPVNTSAEPELANSSITLPPQMPEATTAVPFTKTASPSVTAVRLSTPTLTPHPLDVTFMRQQGYPGSQIVIEETLEPGTNYAQYRVSYLSEGLKIYALMTIPTGQRPESGFPVIVFNHGYIPPDEYRTTERYVAYVQAIARRGYIVLRPDYRGHDRSEGQARGAYHYPDYTIDVLNAVAAIKQHPKADPNRIGMWGHSMGGYITLRVMVTTQDVRAGVIWAGVTAPYEDLMTRWRATRTPGPGTAVPAPSPWWLRSASFSDYGSPEDNPDFWNSISPAFYLGDLSGPIQLHHGADDEVVPVYFSTELYEQAGAVDAIAELYTYPGDNHNISLNFSEAMTRSLYFFDRYVKEVQQ
jgi:uncharacterized protein